MALAGNNVTSESDPDERTVFAHQPWDRRATGLTCGDGVVDYILNQGRVDLDLLASWLGREDIAGNPAFADRAALVQHLDLLRSAIQESVRDLPSDTVVDGLRSAGMLAARRWQIADLADHPHQVALGMVAEDPSAGHIVRLPFVLDGVRLPLASREE
jgi:crotonobetainyl-CoA:carnitine CoA-transferase CaiB-like acyl-CoA transferase